MTSLEGWQNPERKHFGPTNQREAATLSRSAQTFYQPVDRQSATVCEGEMLYFGLGRTSTGRPVISVVDFL